MAKTKKVLTAKQKQAVKKRKTVKDAKIAEMAEGAGVTVEVMKQIIAITTTLKKVEEAVENIEKALMNVQTMVPSRQVQFMLQDTLSIKSHIASFVMKGPLPPHAEIPLEKSELKIEDVQAAFEDASEPEEQTELKLVSEEEIGEARMAYEEAAKIQ